MWRSLVAHLTGGQGVAGSNPVIPTVFVQVRGPFRSGGAALLVSWVPKPRSTDGLSDGVVFGAGWPGRCWDVRGLPVCPALPLSVFGRSVLVGVSGRGGGWGEDCVVER